MDLAPQGFPRLPGYKRGKSSTFFLGLILISLFFSTGPETMAEPGQDNSGADLALFKKAEEAFRKGNTDSALETLSTLRTDFPASEWIDESFILSARITLSLNEGYKARYYLKKVMTESYNQVHVAETTLLLADIYYKERIFNEALTYYQSGIKLAGKLGKEIQFPLERIYLRLAELTYYQTRDYTLARNYFKLIKKPFTAKEDIAAYDLLKRRLAWESITPAEIGVEDGNISAISVDGDDLWIGTWNGGVARYSYSTGKIKLFKEGVNSITDNSILAIEVEKKRVWVGTYNGLSYYLKTDGSWKTIEKFGKARPGKISVIKSLGNDVYVGTLGNGLWKFSKNSWNRVGSGKVPGDYILCIEESGRELYLGTMTNGIYIMDKNRETFRNIDEVIRGFTPRNITMLHEDKYQHLWIGTYGSGLVLWDKKENKLRYYSKKSGEIGDDWVLCGIETAKGMYFGTFGGGAAFFSFKGLQWRGIGIEDGLTSLDIATMAYSSPAVYFGTLGAGIVVYREML